MHLLICRFFALVTLCLGLGGLAQAAGLSKQEFAEQRRFAANNAMFVLYHEVAHLLIDQLDLPVLGREEDVADNMASWMLLSQGTARSEQALNDAVRGWFLSGVAYNSGSAEHDYAAAYMLDKQRAYQIVCMMVGKDATTNETVANSYHLPYERRESCRWDYETVDRSLKGLLDRHNGSSRRGSSVTVTYAAAGGALRMGADAFKASGVFEQVAGDVRRSYNLSAPVRFSAKRCGEANAFYDPDTVEIIFCYELMADYMDIYADNMPVAAPDRQPRAPRKDKHSGG